MAKNWYILYVNVGRELRILEEIKKQVEQSEYKDYVGDIKVPLEKIFEIFKGKKRQVVRTFLSGYVLIEIEMPENRKDSLLLCQFLNRINGVKKIVGYEPNQIPIPVSNEEVKYIFERMGEIKTSIGNGSKLPFLEGDVIRIIDGPFANFTGIIDKINPEKQKIKVSVQIFGRSTPVDLEFNQVTMLNSH